MKIKDFVYGFLFGTLSATVGWTATIEWTLNNAGFDDGGSISGSFNWDSDTDTVVSYSFASTDGSILLGKSYDSSITNQANVDVSAKFIDFNAVGQQGRLRFFFTSINDLDTPVSALSLDTRPAVQNGFFECPLFNVCTPFRVSNGQATLSGRELPPLNQVPLPFSGLMLLGGLGALSILRPRRT